MQQKCNKCNSLSIVSTQFPLTTKGIVKNDIKSKLQQQQPQQPQQQQQQKQNGTTTTCGE